VAVKPYTACPSHVFSGWVTGPVLCGMPAVTVAMRCRCGAHESVRLLCEAHQDDAAAGICAECKLGAHPHDCPVLVTVPGAGPGPADGEPLTAQEAARLDEAAGMVRDEAASESVAVKEWAAEALARGEDDPE
jgi:hypothetical protein